MKKKHRDLLYTLLNSEERLTSTLLAKELHVTSRTVISYVSEINALSREPVITSSAAGYSVITEHALALLNERESYIPQSYMERAYYIIRTILIEHKAINLFDLCESLYISYSTLKAEIRKYNITFEKFGVLFTSRNNILTIEGDESDKRRLLSDVLYQETNKDFIDLKLLNKLFGIDMVDTVRGFISDVCNTHQLYVSDYSAAILLQHLLIMFNRIKNGKYINVSTPQLFKAHELKILDYIKEYTENKFALILSESEQVEIYMLFKMRVSYINSINMDNYELFAGSDIVEITKDLLSEIKVVYPLDLMNNNFIAAFSIHLKNLFDRIRLNQYNRNPMLDNIKQNCPLIYDIAVYMAFYLQRKYNFPIITEDEIAYLALHIGCEMERQKTAPLKISCVLLCPEYLELRESIYNHLMFYHGNEINIIEMLSSPYEIKSLEFSLLITTVDMPQHTEYETYYISPIMLDDNITRLNEKIRKIKAKQKRESFISNFDSYFSKDLFIVNPAEGDKLQSIQVLCDLLEKRSYVQSDFLKQVLEREAMSSTIFNSLAMPHAIKMDAIKTCVGVIISESGIDWDGSKVNVVLLPAITYFEKDYISDIYSILLPVFSSKSVPRFVKQLKTYADFKQYILCNI